MLVIQQQLKTQVAEYAFNYLASKLNEDMVLGIGTGSTVNFFIEILAENKHLFKGVVASSFASKRLLQERGIELFDLNEISQLEYYIDGTDEVDGAFNLVKGGGAALTREKIIASFAHNFVCIADETKKVEKLGKFPLPVEVIPMAQSYVSGELIKLGANPEYRESCITDNGNIILDVHNLDFANPEFLEQKLNNIAGVVCNGVFAQRKADVLLIAEQNGVKNLVR